MNHIEKWQDKFNENDYQEAVAYLNSLDWNLTIYQSEQKWNLIGGDQLIATFETKGQLETFIKGMAFSFAVLPDEIIDHILKLIRD